MKRTRSLQKFAAQFGYEHKNRSNPFSGIKKHANELSKLLDSMFPKDKNDKEKSDDINYSSYKDTYSDPSEAYNKVQNALELVSEGINEAQKSDSVTSVRTDIKNDTTKTE